MIVNQSVLPLERWILRFLALNLLIVMATIWQSCQSKKTPSVQKSENCISREKIINPCGNDEVFMQFRDSTGNILRNGVLSIDIIKGYDFGDVPADFFGKRYLYHTLRKKGYLCISKEELIRKNNLHKTDTVVCNFTEYSVGHRVFLLPLQDGGRDSFILTLKPLNDTSDMDSIRLPKSNDKFIYDPK